jgi:uncharacterized protein
MARCPICKRQVAGRKQNESFPFCSPRCRLIDLGKWLGDNYRIPGKPEENEDEMPAMSEQPTASGDDDGRSS